MNRKEAKALKRRKKLASLSQEDRRELACRSLDQGIVNGKAREVTLSRFAPVARVKIRP
jgi:hypothetical protein